MSAAVVLLILSAPVQADTGILIQEAKTELRELTKTQLDLESEILALDGRLIEAEKDYSWEHDGVFLLKKASDRAQQSGLEVRRFERLDPVPLAHHVEDRVALELYGGFHHIVRYLDELAQLRRIVYVRDLKLSITEFIGEEAMVTANAELVAIHRAEWEGERGALLPVGSVEDAISDPELLLGEYRRVIEETQTRVETVGVIRDARTAGLNNHRLLQLHRSHLVHVLDAIAQASPEKMRILGLQQDGQGLVLEGRSSSNDVLASFLHNLDQSPYLDEVYLSAVEQILEDGIKVKSYRASLKLVTPESSMTRTDQATIEAIDHLLETRAPYRYDPYGKSDPFDLFLVPETGSEGATAQTPLQRFLLQDMELVGVIVTLHRASGLVADPTGMVHRVEVGDYLGTAWGQVVEVGQEFIVVEEEFQSADGDLLVTQKHLGIHSEAEPTDNPDRRIDLTFSGDVHGLVRMLGPHLGINLAVSGDLERQIHLVLRGVDWVTGFSTLLERNGLCVQNFESTYVIRDRYEGREGCQPEVTTELAVTREWQGEPTNYDFVQADIREVFQLFTHQSELAFQFPEAVQASISFHLQGGSWEEAAATLLFVQDLEAEKKRKTWKIHAP